MNRQLSNKKNIMVFVLPALVFFVLLAVVPLIITGFYSFFEYDGISKMEFIGLQNYIKMLLEDKNFVHSCVNTMVLIFASVFIQLPLAFLLAVTLASGVPGEKLFRTIYFIPVVISSMVIGRLWMSVFNSNFGLLNTLIRMLGVPDFNYSWMSNPSTAFISTVIPAVWQYIGYHMMIMYAGIKSIPKDYYEAAQIDGASKFRTTMKITIPLLAPVIKICIVFAICGSIKAFDLIYIMTQGGPNKVSHVPATLMYENLFKRGAYGYGSAQAFFIVIMCFLISWIVGKIFKKAEENATL